MAKITEEWVGKKSSNEGEIDPLWWKLPDEKIAQNVFPLVSAIEKRQTYRKIRDIRHSRLYHNLDILSFQTSLYNKISQDINNPSRISLNVIRSCVDTAASKIAKLKPRPYFLTVDGNWAAQQRAKRLTSFFDGLFQDSMTIYEEKQRSFVDAGIFGTGAVKFYWDSHNKRPACERVMISEIVIDDSEAIYGRPLQLHQTRYVHRAALLEAWGSDKKAYAAIMAAMGSPGEIPRTQTHNDMVKVIESWKLPSQPGAKDGRHALSIDGMTLEANKWTKDYFPFVFDTWIGAIVGFFGTGIAEELTGIQLEINKLIRSIQLAQHFMSVPRVFLDTASNINTSHLNTTTGSIVKYTGQPPIFNTAPAMSPEVYQHLENLYRKAFEIIGISQLAAQSQKPAGLNSGKALRQYYDLTSERFSLVEQRYEATFLEATRICIDLMDEHGADVSVSGKVGQNTEKLVWKDVKMDMKDYVLRIFPASILPSQPQAKLQTVQELIQAGFIEKDLGISLLDFPDLEAGMNMKTAAFNVVQKQLYLMLDKGEAQTPEVFQDLNLSEQVAQWTYLKAVNEGAPEDRLDLVRTYIEDCKALKLKMQQQMQQKMMEAQAQAQAAGGGLGPSGGAAPVQGLGAPAAPPTSDLMPMAAG